jgi:hypothetical protein
VVLVDKNLLIQELIVGIDGEKYTGSGNGILMINPGTGTALKYN